jgi:hypothetical protein
MSCNPLRDLQTFARDIRQIGWSRIPINIERACMIFVNVHAFHSNASMVSAIRVAKLAKWANCECYFICDPTVPEFVDAVRHFSTQTLNFLMFYYAGNVISQEGLGGSASLSVLNGTVGPDLIYATISEKQTDLRIIWMMDGTNNPESWDPLEHDLGEPGVLFMAPYPDDRQAHLQQMDLKNECIFIQEVFTALKSKPTLTAQDLAAKVGVELKKFGQLVFCSAYPDQFKTDLALII